MATQMFREGRMFRGNPALSRSCELADAADQQGARGRAATGARAPGSRQAGDGTGSRQARDGKRDLTRHWVSHSREVLRLGAPERTAVRLNVLPEVT